MRVKLLYDGENIRAYYLSTLSLKLELKSIANFIDKAFDNGEELLALIPMIDRSKLGLSLIFKLKDKGRRGKWYEKYIKEFRVTKGTEEIKDSLLEAYTKIYGEAGKLMFERDLKSIIDEKNIGINDALRLLYHRLFS